MSAEETEQDKQYEPTQKKLDDARKKGDLVKSVDLTTAAAYAGFLLVSVTAGPASIVLIAGVLAAMLAQAESLSNSVFDGSSVPFMTSIIVEAGWGLLPWAIVPGIVAMLAVVAQRGLVFAPSKLEPKLSRISLIKGFGNKFGREGLFEFFKSATKLSIYSIVLGVFLTVRFPQIMGTLQLTPALMAAEFLRMTVQLLFIVLIIALAIGGVDYAFQAAEHQRKNRMSRKEVMDEQKQSEGDPIMKQQRRQRGMEIAMNQMLAEVPEADVIIVNPTHFAVALKWDRIAGQAPVCIAKGVDNIAARIRELAADSKIPIHSDPPTARLLYASVEIGQEIRPDHYRAVAAAIRFADSMRKKARGT